MSSSDPFVLPFIPHTAATQVSRYATNLIRPRGIGIVVGGDGVGKKRALHHWATAEQKPIKHDRVLLLTVPDRGRQASRAAKGLDEVTLGVFSRSRFVLRQRTRTWVTSLYRGSRTHSDEKIYAPHQFNWLFNSVQTEMEAQQICMLVLFHAERFSPRACRELLYLRNEMAAPFGIILCTKVSTNQESSEALQHILGEVPDAAELLIQPCRMAALAEEETKTKIVPALFDQLDADFSPYIVRQFPDLLQTMWDNTQGNWHLLHKAAAVFDQHLGPGSGSSRLLTQSVVAHAHRDLGWPVPPFAH